MGDDRRLIEEWLPIAAIGEESVRERRSMTALPPTYYLHVWWARRPLIASRAAVMASLMPASADHESLLHALGIHGDPVASRRRIDLAKRRGQRFEGEAYSYPRAFTYGPDAEDRSWLATSNHRHAVLLDPTAGGGSIPFEAVRLGLPTIMNDLNPVAALLLRATVEYPVKYGVEAVRAYMRLSDEFVARREKLLAGLYPREPEPDCIPTNYLWARTILCPYCGGVVPLSPNWKITKSGLGVRFSASTSTRVCTFELVDEIKEHSEGTVSGGDAACPFSDCRRVIDGEEIKRQAQDGGMGQQLYAVVFRRKTITRTKNGKKKIKWVRSYRSPRPEDDHSKMIQEQLAEKLAEWIALDIVPDEPFPQGTNDERPLNYGMPLWRDMFSPRQLFCHGASVEIYRKLLAEYENTGQLNEVTRAAFIYLALAIDKLIDRNSFMTRWIPQREVVANTFDSHDFSFKWSYAEVVFQVLDVGYDWAIRQVGKSVRELSGLVRGEKITLSELSEDEDEIPEFEFEMPCENYEAPQITSSCRSADSLDHLDNGSVDVVVMDPPYYDNVMYAELSDFFYVWLKRTAGYVVPELFVRALTDKEHEAVANTAKFKGEKRAKERAGRDYQQRMAAIFAECRRVLKPNGIMTLMFTHKATGAWDALTKGLMEAGFIITASWPVNTEAEGSLNIKDRAAANSTILLVCRPRPEAQAGTEPAYWEEVEPLVALAVRKRIEEFQKAGIRRVDLYLASFGPALQEFSEHWPLRRGTPRPKPEALKRRRQAELFEEEWDPFAVTPEDALDAARREVKNWRLQQLTHLKGRADLDPLTSFYVLAWDTFGAPKFDFGEALTLGRAIGVDIEKEIIGHIAEKKGSEVVMWDSARRAAKGALGAADGSTSWLDALHHAAYAARSRNLQAANELLEKAGVREQGGFYSALEALLEVLPVSTHFSGIELEGDVREFGSDFEALENLRRLSFSEDVDEPEQLKLWKEEAQGE